MGKLGRAGALLVALLLASTTTACSSSGPAGANDAPNSGTPGQSDITQLTDAMLVDQSAFPSIEGAAWYGPYLKDHPSYGNYPIDPPQCWALYFGPKAIRTVEGGLTIGSDPAVGLYSVTIAVPGERPDLKSVVAGCGHYTVGGANETVSGRSLTGLPDWATAFEQSEEQQPGGVAVMGFYRGIFVSIVAGSDRARSSEDQAALVKAFTAQVAKLDAA